MRPTTTGVVALVACFADRRFGLAKSAEKGKSQLSELRGLEKENARLKKIVAELEFDKLILKESLDYLKPRA